MSLKIMFLKLQPHLPGANELINIIRRRCWVCKGAWAQWRPYCTLHEWWIQHFIVLTLNMLDCFKHYKHTVKCHYNACHYNANASLTRSILGSQTAPTSWHALMTVPEWLSTWAKGVKSSRSDRPQRQWHLFVPIQMEQNKRIPPAGDVNTVDSWLIFDQTHWLFISDALRMPPFGQYGC